MIHALLSPKMATVTPSGRLLAPLGTPWGPVMRFHGPRLDLRNRLFLVQYGPVLGTLIYHTELTEIDQISV
jgi:hypothetical protein